MVSLVRRLGRVGLGWVKAIGLRVVLLYLLYVSVTIVAAAWGQLRFTITGIVTEGLVVRQAEELVADAGPAGPADGKDNGIAGRFAVQLVKARKLYRAIVEFRDGERTYATASAELAPVHLYALASHVDVIYPRGRPQDARLKPELSSVYAQAWLLLLGTLVGSGAAYWWWKLFGPRRRTGPFPGGRKRESGH
jgi:hypothetical protein